VGKRLRYALDTVPTIAPGSTLSHFEILEKLGEGGMGVVYKARDRRLDRLVAIKVLPEKAIANPEREARFVQEAKAASALNHPNIITVHEIDTVGDTTFVAMEYVDGRTLDQLIPRRGLRVSEALKYSVQITEALAAAHSIGIVHRDLKPANIIPQRDGAGYVHRAASAPRSPEVGIAGNLGIGRAGHPHNPRRQFLTAGVSRHRRKLLPLPRVR
jgi:serine/threonine protein kinase